MLRLKLTLAGALATVLCAQALAATYRAQSWYGPVLLAVAVVVGAATLQRWLRVPVALQPLLSLLTLLAVVTAYGASESARLGFLPTHRSLDALGALYQQGFDDIHDLVAPVDVRTGLELITVTGVAVVAVLVDYLAVSLRRTAVAGLPLLALFAVPAAVVPRGAGLVPFLLGAAGWLLLLHIDGSDRVRRWGRALGAPTPRRPATDDELPSGLPLAATGRRIGTASLAVAALLPLLIPGLHGGVFPKTTTGFGASGGYGTGTVRVPPLTTIAKRLHDPRTIPLLEEQTDQPGYLRLTALDEFNGRAFTLAAIVADKVGRLDGQLPSPLATGTATNAVTAQISVSSAFVEPYAPVPYALRSVQISGAWRYDVGTGTLFSASTDTRGQQYVAVADEPAPSAEQLRAIGPSEGVPPDLTADLSAPVSRQVSDLAARVVAGRPTIYDQMLALQAFFRTQFRYDLGAGPVDAQGALEQFLFTDRVGYCEQFATAFTAMARTLGVPARVAIGFVPGTPDGQGGYLVTNKDAHAWPEVWFSGVGWVRFEPTPRSDGAAAPPPYAVGSGTIGPLPTPTVSPTPRPTPSGESGNLKPTAKPAPVVKPAGNGGSSGGWPLSPRALMVGGIGVLALLTLLGPGLFAVVLRRRRYARAVGDTALAHAGWADLLASAANRRVDLPAGESPRRAGARLHAVLAGPTGEGPAAPVTAAIDRLVRAEERARYALSPLPAAGLSGDAATVRGALAAGSSRWCRVRAVVLPPSVLGAGGRAAAAALSRALAAVDRPIAQGRRAFRRALAGVVRRPGRASG